MDEEAWKDASPITDFVQSEPFEGQTASERTDVRLLADLCQLQREFRRFPLGPSNQHEPGVEHSAGGKFSIAFSWARNAIDLPQGAFTTNLGVLQATYNFTTSLLAQTLIQYNDRTYRWSTNLRFS